jgi:predicted lipid-binding transport protein (Tim44 family)
MQDFRARDSRIAPLGTRPNMEQRRQDPDVEQREEHHVERSARSTGLGGLVGALAGGALGGALGVAFLSGTAAWAVVLAAAIAGAVLGAFWGGMASLESPDPGSEPSETEHPVRDVPSLTPDEGEGEA